jgi:hypothetical protein
MKEVTLNHKEQKHPMVLNEVIDGRLTGQEAAGILGASLRQGYFTSRAAPAKHDQAHPRNMLFSTCGAQPGHLQFDWIGPAQRRRTGLKQVIWESKSCWAQVRRITY